jgi:carboxylesterase
MTPFSPETVPSWNRTEAELGVEPEHRTFLRDGDRGSVLLLHGGGGSPLDLLPLADDLTGHGFRVLTPLLPAHGLGDEALHELRFAALVERALEAHDALAGENRDPVAVVGLSLGGVLGVRVAAHRGVAALVALAPAFRPFVGRRIAVIALEWIIRPRCARTRYRWQREAQRGIREAEAEIPVVTAPLLVLHSKDDTSVSVRGSRLLYERASSKEKRLVLLKGQGHVLTRAPDREAVYGPVRRFLMETVGH